MRGNGRGLRGPPSLKICGGGTMGTFAVPIPLRQGTEYPGPATAMWLTTKPNNLREFGICRQASSWVKEKRTESLGENLFSPRLFFRFSTVRLAHRRPAQALAAQERLSAIKPLVAIHSVYGDNTASFGSFLGYRKERPRYRIFGNPLHSHQQNCLFEIPFGLPRQRVCALNRRQAAKRHLARKRRTHANIGGGSVARVQRNYEKAPNVPPTAYKARRSPQPKQACDD